MENILISCGYVLLFTKVVNLSIMGLGLRQSLMVLSTTGMEKYISCVPLLLFTCKLHCLQTFEHANAYCIIKVFVMFQIHIY